MVFRQKVNDQQVNMCSERTCLLPSGPPREWG